MKIQLVNTFLVFYLLLPFSRFLDPLPLVLPFVLVHRFCGFVGLAFSRIRFTHRNISRNRCLRNRCLQSMFAICRAMLSRFQFVYDWSVVIHLQFLRSLQTSTISSLTYCPIFVRLDALVFDFYDRLWIVEYR